MWGEGRLTWIWRQDSGDGGGEGGVARRSLDPVSQMLSLVP